MKEFVQNAVSKRFTKVVEDLITADIISGWPELYKKMGLSKQSAYQIREGKRDVTIEQVNNLITIFQVNPYLLFTDGNIPKMITQNDYPNDYLTEQNGSDSVKENPSGYSALKRQEEKPYNVVYVVDEIVRAGLMEGFSQELTKKLEPISMPWLGKGTFYIVNVYGDSMYPTLSNGDRVAVKQISNADNIRSGEVYVIVTADKQVIKRLYKHKTEPNTIIVHSDNDEVFPPYEMSKFDIKALFIVQERSTTNIGKNTQEKQLLKVYRQMLRQHGIDI